MNDPDQDTLEVLGKIEELEEAAEEIRSKQRSLAKNSSARLAHKICCGLDYLIARYDEVMVDGSKVRRRNIEYLSMDNILRDTWQMKIWHKKNGSWKEPCQRHELPNEFQESAVCNVDDVQSA